MHNKKLGPRPGACPGMLEAGVTELLKFTANNHAGFQTWPIATVVNFFLRP